MDFRFLGRKVEKILRQQIPSLSHGNDGDFGKFNKAWTSRQQRNN